MIYSSAARLTLPQMAYRVTLLRIILAGWQPHGLALLPCLIASSPSHFILAVPENQLVVIALGTSEIADLHVGVSAVQVGWLIFRIQSQAGRVVADRGVVIAFASIDDSDPELRSPVISTHARILEVLSRGSQVTQIVASNAAP